MYFARLLPTNIYHTNEKRSPNIIATAKKKGNHNVKQHSTEFEKRKKKTHWNKRVDEIGKKGGDGGHV
jgi:hypothetical protein